MAAPSQAIFLLPATLSLHASPSDLPGDWLFYSNPCCQLHFAVCSSHVLWHHSVIQCEETDLQGCGTMVYQPSHTQDAENSWCTRERRRNLQTQGPASCGGSAATSHAAQARSGCHHKHIKCVTINDSLCKHRILHARRREGPSNSEYGSYLDPGSRSTHTVHAFAHLVSPLGDDGGIATLKASPRTGFLVNPVLQHVRVVDGWQVHNIYQRAHAQPGLLWERISYRWLDCHICKPWLQCFQCCNCHKSDLGHAANGTAKSIPSASM